jgi:peptidoglycan/xylan/chitin deacetylase (PgdA/CDA1 family)
MRASTVLAVALAAAFATASASATESKASSPTDAVPVLPSGLPATPADVQPRQVKARSSVLPNLRHQEQLAYPLGYYNHDPLPDYTVYLTFDDGPSDWTSKILDILKEKGVHATFFVTSSDEKLAGKKLPPGTHTVIDYYADDLRRMVAEGHVIGSHTLRHSDLARLKPQTMDYELDTLTSQIRKAVGDPTYDITLLRPPFGSPFRGNWNTALDRNKVTRALNGKMIVVMWTEIWNSADSDNWSKGEWFERGPRIDPSAHQFADKVLMMETRILRNMNGEGGVALFHDTHNTDIATLPIVIDALKAWGYSFATMEDYVQWRWHKSSRELLDSQKKKDSSGTAGDGVRVQLAPPDAAPISSEPPLPVLPLSVEP